MINKTCPSSISFLFCFFILCLFCGQAAAGNNLNKKTKNIYLSPALTKKFYTVEVQTTRFLDRQQSKVNGLVESFRGTSRFTFDIFTRAFGYGRGGVLDCQSFTYDSAVAVMAYTLAGQTRKAQYTLDAYQKEFYRQKNNYIGLCNSYRTDTEQADGLSIGIDGIRIHLGPTMWVTMAVIHYTAITEDIKYLGFALDMAKWAQQLKHWEFEDGQRGGVSMGYGWGPDWSQVYSTENNVDYYGVLSMLRELYVSGNRDIRDVYARHNYSLADIDIEMKGVERWTKEVAYDTEKKTFYCGYNEKGPYDINALDTVGWTIAAFGPKKLQDMGIDPFYLMDHAEKNFLVNNVVGGELVEGFDFTDVEGRNNPARLVWLEGTGIHIVAYQIMSRYAKSLGRGEKSEEYRLKAVKFSDQLEKAAKAVQLIDNALPYTSKQFGEKEVMYAYFNEWELPRGHNGQWVASVSSTVWRYYALAGFNPLSFNSERVMYKLIKASRVEGAFVARK